jgi:hypothetical protein
MEGKKKCLSPCMKHIAAFALIFFCSSLFSPVAYSQDFSSIDTDLQTLENLNGRRGHPAGIINFLTIDKPRSLL